MSEDQNEPEPEVMAPVALTPEVSGAAGILEKLRAALADEPKNVDCLAALAAAVVDVIDRERLPPRRNAAAECFQKLLMIVAFDRWETPKKGVILPEPRGIIIP